MIGLRYERLAQKVLDREFPGRCVHGVWVYDGRYHEIDSLVLAPPEMFVVEIKIRHMRESFGQLQRYSGLCREMFPDWNVRLLEVCKYYDPAESYPKHEVLELREAVENPRPLAVSVVKEDL